MQKNSLVDFCRCIGQTLQNLNKTDSLYSNFVEVKAIADTLGIMFKQRFIIKEDVFHKTNRE